MATIKAIEAKSVHQIQSGQVIVDLCSVVKELVENSLDAGATAVEVRFKNNGLDSIEVQDNGSGIAPSNYENIALKHFTSKLSSYDDLSTLNTFGFRGEALSSLCALSKFAIITAQANEAPKGNRLEFDTLGRLRSTTVIAAQKGTTVIVEDLFESLPVRRKELSKNIKREYGKVLGLLHAYACIGVNVKFTVKNTMPKAKSVTVFATQGNATTRENIANVYGTKTLSALAPLDLDLQYQPTLTQMARKEKHTSILVKGHISKPVFGEGRQTPDRQMFFVNGRPCGLPQIAKAINEVYKAYNVSQSPFIFADLQMDTNSYDVNVSPDKRTILIHDSASLVENLKTALNEMFDEQEQTVPQSQLPSAKLPAFQRLNFQRQASSSSPETTSQATSPSDVTSQHGESQDGNEEDPDREAGKSSLFRNHFKYFTSSREEPEVNEKQQAKFQKAQEKRAEKIAQKVSERNAEVENAGVDEYDDVRETAAARQEPVDDQVDEEDEPSQYDPVKTHVRDFNARMAEARSKPTSPQDLHKDTVPRLSESDTARSDGEKGVMPSAFDRMRPKRIPAEVATVTVGDQTFTTIIGSQIPSSAEGRKGTDGLSSTSKAEKRCKDPATMQFSQTLRRFGAGGTASTEEQEDDVDDDAELAANEGGIAEDEDEELEVDQVADPDNERVGADSDAQSESGNSEEEDDDEYALETTNIDYGAETGPDGDYIDEEEKKRAEEAKVAKLIQAAEASSALPLKENLKRAAKTLAGGRTKDSTTNLLATVNLSISSLVSRLREYGAHTTEDLGARGAEVGETEEGATQDPEARLSLTVSKADFAMMRIVGQFNLGFVLAVRPANPAQQDKDQTKQDELFIIDQHASDEKYNFERLQAETIVGNQRLVRPVVLDLTAVEEEVVLENNHALEKNGFLVEIDTSGKSMVGQRCSLISLPLSKEVVFGVRDLEELIQLLAESPGYGESGVPRPGKVRKMFAMRACRSSIMIGKTLSRKQMEQVVAHMGTIDKPWNCPHGRPTMRHLCSLETLTPWREEHNEYQGRHLSLGEALHRYVEDD